MASGFSQDSIADFLRRRGGRATSSELVEHFQAAFPQEPQSRAAVRGVFKSCVDGVAFVRTDHGVKHVCLRRQFRHGAASSAPVGQCDDGDAARPQVQPQAAQESGYGTDWRRVPHAVTAGSDQPDKPDGDRGQTGSVGALGEVDGGSALMGNSGSSGSHRKDSQKLGRLDIPEITVIQASPLPVDGSVFVLPGRDRTDSAPGGQKAADPPGVGCRQTLLSARDESEEKEDECSSLSGSEDGCSPKGSRRHFIRVMMDRSPEVRRSAVLRNSAHVVPKSDDDDDSPSLDPDGTSVTLDPAEHEWMMCASDAEWASLRPLLAAEPNLVLKKDFVTGFTCLHWAAKHGKPELIALIVNFAKQHDLPVSVDVRSSAGYTPLHIAAIHSRMEVLKLLVGAYNADVEIRDYSGRKACQYLTDNTSLDIRDIIGAYEVSEARGAESKAGGRWRFSSLKPLHLLGRADGGDAAAATGGEDRPRNKPVRRRSSLGRMKPSLHKMRLRASQIVHSASFRDKGELDESEEKPDRACP